MPWGAGVFRQDPNTSESNPAFLVKALGEESGVLIKGNGTTNWNSVYGGTILGRITASQKLRPVGLAVLTAAQAGGTSLTVGTNNIKTIYNDDTVSLISKLGVLGYVVIPDLDGVPASGHSIDVNGTQYDGLAHKVILADPSAASSPLFTGITIAAGVATITVSLETDGGSALVSTIDEVIAELNASAAAYVNATLAGGATGSTVIVAGALGTFTLAGQVSTGGAIASGLTVSNVNLSAGTLTVSSSVIAEIGDYLATEDGSSTAVGILIEGVTTLPLFNVDADPQNEDVGASMVTFGIVYEPGVTGVNAETKADLPRIEFRAT
jgi:hypothetical protein